MAEHLYGIPEAQDAIPRKHENWTWYPHLQFQHSTEGPEVYDHPQLPGEFKVSLSYIGSCLKRPTRTTKKFKELLKIIGGREYSKPQGKKKVRVGLNRRVSEREM